MEFLKNNNQLADIKYACIIEQTNKYLKNSKLKKMIFVKKNEQKPKNVKIDKIPKKFENF